MHLLEIKSTYANGGIWLILFLEIWRSISWAYALYQQYTEH